jgi:hypothetical protein
MNSSSKYALRGVFIAITVAIGVTPLTGQTRTADPFRWDGSVAPGSTVEIKGVNGSIRAVSATGSSVVVDAVRTGRRNDPTEVEIVVVEHAGGVTVCAVYPSALLQRNECLPGDEGRIGARNNDVQVAFTVQVPATANFSARTANGAVSAVGLTREVVATSTNGDVNVEGGTEVLARTTNGSVSIRTSGSASARSTNGSISADHTGLTEGEGPLTFSTTNGPITLRLPANTNATINASTTNGGIESDLPVTVQGNLRRNRLMGTIGTGGRTIELRTTNGRIHLERSS